MRAFADDIYTYPLPPGHRLPLRKYRLLPTALERSRPSLGFYLAGADPYEGDRLGRLMLTKPGLAARDRLVRGALAAAGVPVRLTLAGGYADPIEETVEINVATLRIFAGRTP